MTSQELVGRAMIANRALDLPTKHKVAAGEAFRYLQAHLDRGAMAHMWVQAGTVTLLDEDATIPFPAEPVGPAGRRRGRVVAAMPDAPDDTAEPAAPLEDASEAASGDAGETGDAMPDDTEGAL